MSRILKHIHLLFWVCIPIFLLYTFFNSDAVIDINIHDTMFVIAIKHAMIFGSFVLFIIGLVYYLSYQSNKFRLFNSLTIFHALVTFVGLIILFLIPKFQYELPVDGTKDMLENLRKLQLNNVAMQYSVAGVVFAQLVFIINLTIGIFRR